MLNSIENELANKVFHLHKALLQAEKVIQLLEKQNSCLKDALANLAPINKEDYADCFENPSESIIKI